MQRLLLALLAASACVSAFGIVWEEPPKTRTTKSKIATSTLSFGGSPVVPGCATNLPGPTTKDCDNAISQLRAFPAVPLTVAPGDTWTGPIHGQCTVTIQNGNDTNFNIFPDNAADIFESINKHCTKGDSYDGTWQYRPYAEFFLIKPGDEDQF